MLVDDYRAGLERTQPLRTFDSKPVVRAFVEAIGRSRARETALIRMLVGLIRLSRGAAERPVYAAP